MLALNEKGLELIKKYEGFRANAYLCPAGIKTIGYGHVIKDGEDFGIITEGQALEMLIKDAKFAESSIRRNIQIQLSDNQYNALISFIYNVGGAAFQRSCLRQKINRREFETIEYEFLRWVKAKGFVMPGLIARRKEEAKLFLFGL